MVDYNPKSWIKLIFAFHKSDTFRILRKEILYIGIFTLLIAFVTLRYFPNAIVLEKLIAIYSLIGFVLSLLLVFRTNTAYERWWEGRKKWGEIVNDTRNLSIKLSAILSEKEDKSFFKAMIPNFAFAAKEHLRQGVIFEELTFTKEQFDAVISKKHVPLAICEMMYIKLIELKKATKITEEEFIILDKNLNALMDSLGACERIKNTPIPVSYSLFIKKFIFIYVMSLPLAFVIQFGYFSALIATFVFYVLVSMEVLAEEIEDPFGNDESDLPTDTLCERIKINIEEVFN
jgi:putative membrane protein